MKNFRIRMVKTSKKIKKYTFVKPINESRFRVYLVSKLAKKKNIKIHYAAKIFQSSNWSVFLNELEVSKRLDHPNIIKLKFTKTNIPLPLSNAQSREEFDILFFENAPYGDLLTYLIEGGCFEESLARTIFKKVLSGMEAMHSKNIAHLDIKPDNIVIGSKFEVKLIDFGHCRFVTGPIMADFNVGTPSYLPPELRSRTPYNPFKIDVFNLGILLFCLLAAQSPFEVADSADYRYKHIVNRDYKSFWSLLDKSSDAKVKSNFASESVKTLIFQMLAYDPYLRPSFEDIRNSEWMQQSVLEPEGYSGKMRGIWNSMVQQSKTSDTSNSESV